MVFLNFSGIRISAFVILFALPLINAKATSSDFDINAESAEVLMELNTAILNINADALELDNWFRRLFTSFTSKAERTSRSQRHSSRPKRYSPPQSNSRNPDSHSGRRGDLPSSDMSAVNNEPKMPLQASLRETYLYRGAWELGLSAGTAHALTDIADNKNLAPGEFMDYHTNNFDLSFGFFGRYVMNTWFAIKLGAEYTSLSASNISMLQNPEIPAVSFENEIFEFFGRTEFMIPALARSPLDIYGFFGIGIFFTDAQLFDENSLLVQVPDDYSQVQPFIPLGVGFNVRVSERLKLGYEFGWRNTIFHYLDGVRVPGQSYDKYFVNSLKISYKF
jgi:hypothetical protein